jgi:hypothetical protein
MLHLKFGEVMLESWKEFVSMVSVILIQNLNMKGQTQCIAVTAAVGVRHLNADLD